MGSCGSKGDDGALCPHERWAMHMWDQVQVSVPSACSPTGNAAMRPSCLSGHAMRQFTAPASGQAAHCCDCDGHTGSAFIDGVAWRCEQCDWDACPACAKLLPRARFRVPSVSMALPPGPATPTCTDDRTSTAPPDPMPPPPPPLLPEQRSEDGDEVSLEYIEEDVVVENTERSLDVRKGSHERLGLKWDTPGNLILRMVAVDSPVAGQAEPLLGWRLVSVDGVPVASAEDVRRLAAGNTAPTLTFRSEDGGRPFHTPIGRGSGRSTLSSETSLDSEDGLKAELQQQQSEAWLSEQQDDDCYVVVSGRKLPGHPGAGCSSTGVQSMLSELLETGSTDTEPRSPERNGKGWVVRWGE
eukprot:TRINITY_DN12055_c0_g1_i1.p1 TRINITY_DN12055_c0_g1~~TRINITY_DN12055_c0_g1_i1.p1  ORF type:complete len:356 (+),score=90.49 TRINITY_DN12055_c0_g1_i1:73-1140(+)